MNLKETVGIFLNGTCEGLGYDEAVASREKVTGAYFGKSLKQNQIPYNMQMDIMLTLLKLFDGVRIYRLN